MKAKQISKTRLREVQSFSKLEYLKRGHKGDSKNACNAEGSQKWEEGDQ